MEEAKEPSDNMVSTFHDRKVVIYQKWPEAEMNLVEYILSESCDEGYIIYNSYCTASKVYLLLYQYLYFTASYFRLCIKCLHITEF